MAGFLVPVGHLLGPLFAGDETAPESIDVRVGDGVVSLSPASFAVWSAAHGDARVEPFVPASRSSVLASTVDVPNAPRIFGDLVAKGLLVELERSERPARTFAQAHRLIPLVFGLGNSHETPDIFTLGMINEPRATASGLVYSLWMSAHRSANLWDACENVASTTRETTGIIVDPMYLLMEFVGALPGLIATSCVCVDRRSNG